MCMCVCVCMCVCASYHEDSARALRERVVKCLERPYRRRWQSAGSSRTRRLREREEQALHRG